MCLNDFLCPPRVLLSARVKRSLTGTAINPFKIVYRLVSLKACVLDADAHADAQSDAQSDVDEIVHVQS